MILTLKTPSPNLFIKKDNTEEEYQLVDKNGNEVIKGKFAYIEKLTSKIWIFGDYLRDIAFNFSTNSYFTAKDYTNTENGYSFITVRGGKSFFIQFNKKSQEIFKIQADWLKKYSPFILIRNNDKYGLYVPSKNELLSPCNCEDFDFKNSFVFLKRDDHLLAWNNELVQVIKQEDGYRELRYNSEMNNKEKLFLVKSDGTVIRVDSQLRNNSNLKYSDYVFSFLSKDYLLISYSPSNPNYKKSNELFGVYDKNKKKIIVSIEYEEIHEESNIITGLKNGENFLIDLVSKNIIESSSMDYSIELVDENFVLYSDDKNEKVYNRKSKKIILEASRIEKESLGRNKCYFIFTNDDENYGIFSLEGIIVPDIFATIRFTDDGFICSNEEDDEDDEDDEDSIKIKNGKILDKDKLIKALFKGK